MSQHRFPLLLALISAAAVATLGPLLAPGQMRSLAGTAVLPAAPPTSALGDPGDLHPTCRIVANQDRLDYPLVRVSHHLESERSIKIVAIGSSSTAGAGASSPEATYPSRLEAELTQHFLWQDITVLNRGTNGEEVGDMLARASTPASSPKSRISSSGRWEPTRCCATTRSIPRPQCCIKVWRA